MRDIVVYRVPLWERYIKVGDIPSGTQKAKGILSLEGDGVYVYYGDDISPSIKELEDQYQSGAGVGRKSSMGYLACNDGVGEIQVRLEVSFPAAKIGGKDLNSRALSIRDDSPIFELPYCKRFNVSGDGSFMCDEKDGISTFSTGCIIATNTRPSFIEDCPVEYFWNQYRKMEEAGFIMGENVLGHTMIRARRVFLRAAAPDELDVIVSLCKNTTALELGKAQVWRLLNPKVVMERRFLQEIAKTLKIAGIHEDLLSWVMLRINLVAKRRDAMQNSDDGVAMLSECLDALNMIRI